MGRTILLLCFSVSLFQLSWAFCPHECVCDDHSLEASCIKSNLEVNIGDRRERARLYLIQLVTMWQLRQCCQFYRSRNNICFPYCDCCFLLKRKLKKNSKGKKIMNSKEIKRFIMFYERITLQMMKDLSKSASVTMFLKKNNQIKKILFRS